MRLEKMKLLGLCLLLTVVAVPAFAQTAPLDEKQKAVLMFDMRMDLLMNSDLAKSMNLADQLEGLAANQSDGPDPSTISRVFGAVGAPENLQAAQQMGSGSPPMDFFVKMQFKDAAAATAAANKMLAKEHESFEQNGKTFYRPKNDEAPENAVFHQVDETTLEMGTDLYVLHPTHKVMTDGLSAAWAKVPDNEAIRIAVDLEGAKGLIGEAVEQGKKGGNPMVAGYLELVDNMKNVRLSIDFAGPNLLTLQSTGVDSEQAEELGSGLDAILGMAKMGGTAQVNNMKQQDPETAAVMEKILSSLKSNVEADEVSVVIPKPAGFEDAVKRTAAMFGMGAPPQ